MNAAATNFDGENKYIRITDIDDSSSVYNSDFPVSPSGEIDNKFLVKENDILFARTGASTGKTYLYDIEDGKLYFAGFLIRAKITNTNNSRFIFNQTKTSSYSKWVKLMSMRSGQPGINSQEYASFKFWIPPKSEQDKIASFLFLLDNRIQTQKKIIAQLESLMQGLREKIFSQQLRFKNANGNDFPEWETDKLGNLGTFFSGGTPLTSKKEYFSGNIPFIRSGEINAYKTEQFISEEGLKKSSAKMVEVGDLIYALYGATSGEVGISKIKGAINQAILCIRTTLNNIFLLHYLRLHKENILKTYLQGGQGNLSAEILKSLKVPVPLIEEQNHIAYFFSSIDKKIQAEKKILVQYENQKKHLLQNMFI